MRRFVFNIAGFFLIQGAIAALLLSQYRGVGQHFFAATNEKHRLAATAPGPRLIIVGGSNAMYPFDSARIHHLTGYHPVNMSMYGPLGSGFMLNEALDIAKPGDVVLLSLEYQHFVVPNALIPYGDLAILLEARPASARYVPWPSLQRLLDNGIGWGQDVLFAPQNAWRRLEDTIYVRTAFNGYGDFVAHLPLGAHYEPAPAQDTPRQFEMSNVMSMVARLNRFVDACAARDVRVAFAFPPMANEDLALRASLTQSTFEAMRLHFGGAVLNTPWLAGQDKAMFFDSPYHVTREGRDAHMNHLLPPLMEFLRGAGEGGRRR